MQLWQLVQNLNLKKSPLDGIIKLLMTHKTPSGTSSRNHSEGAKQWTCKSEQSLFFLFFLSKWPGGALMWPRGTLKNPLGHKKKKTERVDKAYWMYWCASWVWIACWSECKRLWGCWSSRRAGWKVNGIQEFPGQKVL